MYCRVVPVPTAPRSAGVLLVRRLHVDLMRLPSAC